LSLLFIIKKIEGSAGGKRKRPALPTTYKRDKGKIKYERENNIWPSYYYESQVMWFSNFCPKISKKVFAM
jgi:hypothetical protein